LVTRLYLRDLLTFDEVELEFAQGLVVFTGPSGAGKSVLISAILSSFGYSVKGVAALCELQINKPKELQNEAYFLEEEIHIKTLKKEKLRYFIDAQSIPKKVLLSMFSPYVKYLSVRDQGGFDSSALTEMIDRMLATSDKAFVKMLKTYRKRYTHYRQKYEMLKTIQKEEKDLAEKIEFVQYEIEKITSIDPKPGEEEALLQTTQHLSRLDKLIEALQPAVDIFRYESWVDEVYRLLDKEPAAFSETMNQLRADFEESRYLADTLEEVDIEEVLERLSVLTTLKTVTGR
jgi:DNA repair protein RecN (Recombination protein N)